MVSLAELKGGIVHHLIEELQKLIRMLAGKRLQGLLVRWQRQHEFKELHDGDAQLVPSAAK